MKLLIDLLNVFFPQTCLICGNHLLNHEKIICLNCEHLLPFTDYTDYPDNPFEKKFRGRILIEAATSLLFFRKNSNTQKLIHSLKYHGNQEVGIFFGEILGKQIKKSDRFQKLDGIIMVPLHPLKLKKRGYNQLTKFAQQLSVELEIPVLYDNLIKISDSNSQTTKNKFNRFEKLNEKFQGINLEKLDNKHILLIDDILTTGATLESCANELSKAHNIKISIITMAITDH